MSAGICGKRLWIEEIFGSSSAPSSAKKSRCSHVGSPVRSFKFGLGQEEKISALLRMFPSMDRKGVLLCGFGGAFSRSLHDLGDENYAALSCWVVETVLNSHDQKIDDAINSLHSLCLGEISAPSEIPSSIPLSISEDQPVEATVHTQIQDIHKNNTQTNLGPESIPEGSSWVDILVHEMMEASDWSDVRARVSKVLLGFESHIINHSTSPDQMETASLKEHLQCLLRDNQILKRAVGIQHERNLELEEKSKEVQHLRHVISQYQEQVRSLEMNNYTLKIHLQRAQDARSIPNHFNPDIF
ncbi:uncharacterized protein LOC144714136 isoform X1 [Wolffia australiana]